MGTVLFDNFLKLHPKCMLKVVKRNRPHWHIKRLLFQINRIKSLCKKFFTGLFDVDIGEKENIAKKPEQDEVNEVLKILNIDRTKSIYIGDSEVYIQTA